MEHTSDWRLQRRVCSHYVLMWRIVKVCESGNFLRFFSGDRLWAWPLPTSVLSGTPARILVAAFFVFRQASRLVDGQDQTGPISFLSAVHPSVIFAVLASGALPSRAARTTPPQAGRVSP
jgi:hypothetical protein